LSYGSATRIDTAAARRAQVHRTRKSNFTLRIRSPNCAAFDMDFSDMNYWGIVVVPIGVAICFGPAMLVYWLVDSRRGCEQPAKVRR
jgi:hypothetical protein